MSTFTAGYITNIHHAARLLQTKNDNNVGVKFKMALQQYDPVPISATKKKQKNCLTSVTDREKKKK